MEYRWVLKMEVFTFSLMSLSNAAKRYDYFWEGTFKAEKHSAKSNKTALLVGWGGNDTLDGANKNDKLAGA